MVGPVQGFDSDRPAKTDDDQWPKCAQACLRLVRAVETHENWARSPPLPQHERSRERRKTSLRQAALPSQAMTAFAELDAQNRFAEWLTRRFLILTVAQSSPCLSRATACCSASGQKADRIKQHRYTKDRNDVSEQGSNGTERIARRQCRVWTNAIMRSSPVPGGQRSAHSLCDRLEAAACFTAKKTYNK